MNRATPATGWARNPDGTLGYTLNPVTGCLNHDEKGLCLGGGFPCYAYKLAHGRLKSRYLANDNFRIYKEKYDPMQLRDLAFYGQDPFYPRLWPERLGELHKRKQQLMDGEPTPKGIFVCDMGDLFGEGVPEQWTNDIMEAIWDNDEYDRFYLLTKQPQNLVKFSPFPDNCWVGVTATNTKMAVDAVGFLQGVEANIKYLSLEPLLGNIDTALFHYFPIDWVIIGAQTKPYKPPEIEWVGEIVEACDKAGVAVFLKDNLKPLILDGSIAAGQAALDTGLLNWGGELRQEMPT